MNAFAAPAIWQYIYSSLIDIRRHPLLGLDFAPRVARSLLYLILVAVLMSCAKQEAPPASSPVSIPATPKPVPSVKSDELLDARLDRFCRDLGRIIDAEKRGFEPLRQEAFGHRLWYGTLVPEGLNACHVEGPGRPLAIYDCRTQPLSGQHQGLLNGIFSRTLTDLNHCLNMSTWYPMEWRKGRINEFGRGEKQITWRDITTSPRPIVSLHIEEDFAKRVHYMRLAFGTLK